ncbi:Eukaryotic porin/Tom40 like protein [Aduncisulcus paluster]|uniref:Eukaryotic porin/Tom40 like protein n=1 Tax=Aduncisulcus paluster TaxID=2918883 RepID=A0ABQ5K420_9EUKA|nr:Eukaryotic porin/Tom40 like protein [Aduncisulcus paluster]|eukprot:gnl/Carplike_NY0171/2578_a3460_614.p1 GENE.gnl/Carplike_NY0171/2578_a3460_614~~gnl/Carplike_NY0171/2578_a3460_614.p1  ORF type:complete len:277 (+),score=44.78 gnl/Carplike_NY0171/2578_a3460_614:2-832(+)
MDPEGYPGTYGAFLGPAESLTNHQSYVSDGISLKIQKSYSRSFAAVHALSLTRQGTSYTLATQYHRGPVRAAVQVSPQVDDPIQTRGSIGFDSKHLSCDIGFDTSKDLAMSLDSHFKHATGDIGLTTATGGVIIGSGVQKITSKVAAAGQIAWIPQQKKVEYVLSGRVDHKSGARSTLSVAPKSSISMSHSRNLTDKILVNAQLDIKLPTLESSVSTGFEAILPRARIRGFIDDGGRIGSSITHAISPNLQLSLNCAGLVSTGQFISGVEATFVKE